MQRLATSLDAKKKLRKNSW